MAFNFSACRDFVVRHRIAAAVAAPVALGAAAVVAVAVLPANAPRTDATRLTASVTECHDMVTISIAGRNDSPNASTTKMLLGADGKPLPAALSDDYHSTWEDPVVNAPKSAVVNGNYAAVYIAYPANMSTYEDAVNTGVANTESVMEQIRQACPTTKFAIVGYSEGADVARRVAMQIGNQTAPQSGTYGIVDPKNVTGVVILADNGRSANEAPFPGAQNPYGNPDGFDTKYQTGATPISGQGAMQDNSGGFGALSGRVASFCSEGDLTCAAPQNISLLQLAANVGRQLNVDGLQNNGLTPATGQDVAVTLAKIGFNAFQYIQSQPNWMASNETLLQVLIKVSDPEYKPGQQTTDPAPAQNISSNQLEPLAYLPQKVFNEIVGDIVTNQNTIPVLLSDPYQLTLGPNGTGHHFDYWRDSNPADGKPLTSAQYAAAWLTHLAQQAQSGQKVDPTSAVQAQDVALVNKDVADTKATDARNASTPTTMTVTAPAKPTTTKSPGATTTTTTTTSPAPTTTTTSNASPTTTTTSTTAPTTTSPSSTTTTPTASPTTTKPAASTTTKPAPAQAIARIPAGQLPATESSTQTSSTTTKSAPTTTPVPTTTPASGTTTTGARPTAPTTEPLPPTTTPAN
ncbi:cutinase family protein [Nocardia sp. NEAU-G5]|uniref:Cutinase family protein n=1 Tax=Nocardia albiluteola TaxID=2842303 RepID=A0ABS6AZR4_9NOCA|nr:cutinase family protein [Nocardia albiluteola]MBU3063546.1 cutinase family protein [Nocardia albiluteola]